MLHETRKPIHSLPSHSLILLRIPPQYKDVCRRTIEIPQRTHIFKANYCLTVQNVHLKLASPISGQGIDR